MGIGRSSAGAIKIKTDSPLGLRAVNCACCGGGACACDYHSILSDPTDPDFAARVLGTASNSFTQIALSYSIATDFGTSASGSHSSVWSASAGFYFYGDTTSEGDGYGSVVILDGCILVEIGEGFQSARFLTTQSACPYTDFNGTDLPTEPDDVCAITINGVSYRTARRADFGDAVTGSATITFS